MKVFSVAGYHHTGKTTLVVNLIKELRNRGYSVQSIKDIHNEKFTMEKEGSNSWKHWEASQNTVIARGLNETYQVWHEQLKITQMLSKLDADYVVVEGMKTTALPRILCAESEDQIDELMNGTIIAISGKYANDHKKYNNLKCFSNQDDMTKLVDLIEEKVFEVLPLPDEECCSACGMNCFKMVEKILSGEKNRSDCKVSNYDDIVLTINGKRINMVNYVGKTMKDMILAYTKNLDGFEKGNIKIEINN